MVKAIIFARVSSDRQEYDRQISDLMPLVKGDGYSTDELAIIKHKESAIKNDIYARKSISELRDLVDNNGIEAVYVTEISRLARRNDVMYGILSLLEERKISLVVQTPMVIRTFKNGRPDYTAHAILSFLQQLAISETDVKLQRQKSGYRQKLSEGKILSSKVIFGYKRVNGYAVVEEDKARLVREIFNDYLNDNSVTSIFEKYRHLGIFGKVKNKSGWNRVTRMLRDTTYIGQNKHFNYPRIVEQDVFEKVNSKMDKNILIKSNISYVYYCQGILKLNGHTMTPNANKAAYQLRDTDNGNKCYSINCNVVDYLAFNLSCLALSTMMQKDDGERRKKAAEDLQTARVKLSSIEVEISEQDARKSRIDDIYAMGRYTREKYVYESGKVDEEIAHLLKEKDNLVNLVIQLEGITGKKEERLAGVSDYYQLLDIRDDNERKEIVRKAIRQITAERIANGEYNLTVQYVDPTMDSDTSYRYIQKGCKIRLLEVTDCTVDDWTGCWEERVLSYEKRKKS